MRMLLPCWPSGSAGTSALIGVSFDRTGYGDDGSIWGGEFFAGSVRDGFKRVMHLRPAALPGGDAAARNPVQCAAGFLSQIDGLPAFGDVPFQFPVQYQGALQLIETRLRSFETTSIGRLFDTCAALVGFTREISFEGQAAIWLEHLAQSSGACDAYTFPIVETTLDFRPLLTAVVEDRVRGRDPSGIARAFHKGVARGLADAVKILCEGHTTEIVVLSGGVFQNNLLLAEIKSLLDKTPLRVWTNAGVPPNDGGISLGQAAMGAFHA
jgi:hydrogenase maturation protein HypF